MPKYFILEGAKVNATVILISNSACLPLVYNKVMEFCILILYPVCYYHLLGLFFFFPFGQFNNIFYIVNAYKHN